MKVPTLLIFLDGLSYENIHKLKLIRDIRFNAKIRGKFGFSIACHGSMHTGLEVSGHKYWFVWQRQVNQGIGKNYKWIKLSIFNNVIFRVIFHKIFIRQLKKSNSSFFNIPIPVHCRTKDLIDFTVTEWKNYDEPFYVNGNKGFMDDIREGLELETVGFCKTNKDESLTLKEWKPQKNKDVIFWFLGDVDHFSHEHGQNSQKADEKFKELDKILMDAYEKLIAEHGCKPKILAWSDHGHADLIEKIDVFQNKKLKRLLKNTQHIIDATYLRIWQTSETTEQWRKKVVLISDQINCAHQVLDHQLQEEFNLWPGDNRFGDVIFALDIGYMFSKNIWGWSNKIVSQHGYNPKYRQMDGFVASSVDLFRSKKSIDITKIRELVNEITNQ